MIIILTKDNKIYKLNLPDKISGTYWISDKLKNDEEKLLKIENLNGIFQIKSDSHVQIIKPQYIKIEKNKIISEDVEESIAKSISLKKESIYAVCFDNYMDVNFLYTYEGNRENFMHLAVVNTKKIKIGSDISNNIIYKNVFISNFQAEIFKENDKWFIKNTYQNITIFVNDSAVNDEIKPLENGDVIFIMGLIIIMLNDSIFVNISNKNIKLSTKTFKLIHDKSPKNIKPNKLGKNRKENFYSRSPRMVDVIKVEKIDIQKPPINNNEDGKKIDLTIISSLSMGITSVLFSIISIKSMQNTDSGFGLTFVYILVAILTFFSMIVIPILNIKDDKKNKVLQEKKRQQKYKEYLNKKFELVKNIINKQRKILHQNYLSAKDCEKLILGNSYRLWERQLNDEDFLSVRLGIGDVPADIKFSISEESFEMDEDVLLDLLNEMLEKSKIIPEAPIGISLKDKNLLAIISEDSKKIYEFIQNIIIQLITFQGYDDLKFVFILDGEYKEFDFVKLLPHIWDDFKQIRFFATNLEDANDIFLYLDDVLKNRENNNREEDNEKNRPYYLIITNNFNQIEDIPFIRRFLKAEKNLGISLLCIAKSLQNLPNKCENFIQLKEENGIYFKNKNFNETEKQFILDKYDNLNIFKITSKISNMKVKIKKKNVAHLPKSYDFLQMYNAGTIEKLNILEKWKSNDPTISLKAPIGVDENGNIIYLDIHEKFHGPHGLIAGSTGSGKSEFIITYILSLAVNYHPEDLSFLLIDYKGGGLAGAFEKNNMKLPHVIGTITNIDKNGLKRSLVSIQSELKRRQIMFNKARNMIDEGTIDIYKYQRLYHEGLIKEAIPHLLIVCDEFAELKQQQPEFMEELMSVSRIGRSLGVHLILATQKPAGIVNDQIRSNSKFGVCLKVQDKSDSQDVIEKPDAAFLKTTGQFYLRVGNDEFFTLGQSAWTGAGYIPSEKIEEKVDNSIEFISQIGRTIKRVDGEIDKTNKTQGEQLTNIVNYIYNLAKDQNIKPNNLWLPELKQDIYIKELRKKYELKEKNNSIDVIVGEYDNPAKQEQGLVKFNLMDKNNIAVFGNEKSGKETFLSTIIYEIISRYSSKQAQIYIIDFGTEALKIYKESPHVGDVILLSDEEKLKLFFNVFEEEIKERKNILSNYNGDYDLYLSSGNVMPLFSIIINNFDVFQENFEMDYGDRLLALTRDGLKCGIIFIISATSPGAMRYRLRQNFSKKIALQANKEDDYYEIFERRVLVKPSNLFGRGIFLVNEEEILEFQTAKICEHINYNVYIQKTIDILKDKNEIKAKSLEMAPDLLDINYVQEYLKGIESVPLGLNKEDSSIYTYNFKENFVTTISANNMTKPIEFIQCILEEFEKIPDINSIVLDPEEIRKEANKSLKVAFNEFVSELRENVEKDDQKFTICTIIGIDKFLADEIVDKDLLKEILEIAKKSQKYSFIVLDNLTHLEKYEFDDWFSEYFTPDSGIWIGEGAMDQRIINVEFEIIRDKEPDNIGRVANNGVNSKVKLLGIN